MGVKADLGRKLLQQTFDEETQDELAAYKHLAAGYATLENGIAVLSDLKNDRSYLYRGALAELLDMPPAAEYSEVDSIWEEEIFASVHPDDLLDKHLLELQFFNMVKDMVPSERQQYCGHDMLRMRGRTGVYLPVKHRIFYMPTGGARSLHYALCLYNLAEEPFVAEKSNHAIFNMRSGSMLPLDKGQLSAILSLRERQILRMIRDGKLSKEIADGLSISIHTVNRHRQNILEKLRVKNSIEACSLGEKLNLF